MFNDEALSELEQVCCGRDCQMNTIDVHPLDFQTNIYSLAGLHHPSLSHPVVFLATCAKVYCLLKSDEWRQGPSSKVYPQVEEKLDGLSLSLQDASQPF